MAAVYPDDRALIAAERAAAGRRLNHVNPETQTALRDLAALVNDIEAGTYPDDPDLDTAQRHAHQLGALLAHADFVLAEFGLGRRDRNGGRT